MKGTAMLGRKNYTREEIDQGKVALNQQLAAYKEGYSSVPRTRRRIDVGDLSDAVLCR